MIKCKTCKWWVEDQNQLNSGECRQQPPIPVMTAKNTVSCAWPVTSFGDFCGSHEVDIIKTEQTCVTGDELGELISQAIEKNVMFLDLEMATDGSHVHGRIMIDAEPSEGDLEVVEGILSKSYSYVDISLLKE